MRHLPEPCSGHRAVRSRELPPPPGRRHRLDGRSGDESGFCRHLRDHLHDAVERHPGAHELLPLPGSRVVELLAARQAPVGAFSVPTSSTAPWSTSCSTCCSDRARRRAGSGRRYGPSDRTLARCPQQATVPSARSAQFVWFPAERAMNRPVGTSVRPTLPAPQQWTVPSLCSAQAWSFPASIDVNGPAGDSSWPRSF